MTGIGAGAEWLGTVADHFPPLHLVYREAAAGVGPASVDDNRAVFALDDRRQLLVDRATACATYSGPRPPTAADTVHPLLTAAAAAVGRWSGYELFHAAAFVAEGRVWGLLGEKESGKSTVAAWLAEKGYPVLCDDLLAVKGRTAFAGPRCVDLRSEPARRLGIGQQADTDGPRERWRVSLPPIDAELSLGGWLFLGWAEEVETVPVGPRDLLGRLAASRTWRGCRPIRSRCSTSPPSPPGSSPPATVGIVRPGGGRPRGRDDDQRLRCASGRGRKSSRSV